MQAQVSDPIGVHRVRAFYLFFPIALFGSITGGLILANLAVNAYPAWSVAVLYLIWIVISAVPVLSVLAIETIGRTVAGTRRAIGVSFVVFLPFVAFSIIGSMILMLVFIDIARGESWIGALLWGTLAVLSGTSCIWLAWIGIWLEQRWEVRSGLRADGQAGFF